MRVTVSCNKDIRFAGGLCVRKETFWFIGKVRRKDRTDSYFPKRREKKTGEFIAIE